MLIGKQRPRRRERVSVSSVIWMTGILRCCSVSESNETYSSAYGDAAGLVEGVGGCGRVNTSEKNGEESESKSLNVLKSTGSLSEDLSMMSASGWSNGAAAGVPLVMEADRKCSGLRETQDFFFPLDRH